MSITDPLEIGMWHEYYIIIKGRETFYDDDNKLIMFDTEEEAQEWIDDYNGRRTKRQSKDSKRARV